MVRKTVEIRKNQRKTIKLWFTESVYSVRFNEFEHLVSGADFLIPALFTELMST